MKRVIIVDDHEIVRKGIKETLEDVFGEIEFAESTDADQALEMAGKGRWDLMLLDIGLGDAKRSGIEILDAVKRSHPKIPVLIMSMYPEAEFGMRVIRMGAAGYVNKEAASDDLLAAVKKVFSGGKYISSVLAECIANDLHRGSNEETPLHEQLPPRQLELLTLIAKGKSLKEIATILGISIKTVGHYHTRLLDSMQMKSDVDLTRYAIFNKLVT
jgi:two-component system, NarL family, invasion response regulator UvrY